MDSVAELRATGRLRALGNALDSESLLRFTKGGRTFPPKRRISKGAVGLLASYEGRLNEREPEMWFFARDEEPAGDLDVMVEDDARIAAGMVHVLNGRYWTTSWFAAPDRLDNLDRFLTGVADAAGAFYAYCTLSDLEDQRVTFLKRNGQSWIGRLLRVGRVIEDLQRELPDVYWWNYFGPAYVAKWGGRLDGLGVRQERTRAGALVIWATETPFVFESHVSRLDAYSWKKKFYDALGSDTFMHEGQGQRAVGEVVPNLNAHRVATGARPLRSVVAAEPPQKVLPRIVSWRNPGPDAEADLDAGEGLEVKLTADSSPSSAEIGNWLKRRNENAVHGRTSQGRLIVYRNPDTAVEAGFAEVEGGLLFKLPYVRPGFFPEEAIPLVIDLAHALGLKLPANASTADKLTDLWRTGNEEALRQSLERPPYMDSKRSRRWWLYQSHKSDLHRRLGEEVFVPTLVAVGPGGRTDDLRLHITWTDAIPLVLPECDLVTLLTGKRQSQFKVRGTARYVDAMKALAPLLDSIDVDGLGAVPVLLPQSAKEARHLFDELPTKPLDHVELEPATWVDVRN